jgi:hypothetical protein
MKSLFLRCFAAITALVLCSSVHAAEKDGAANRMSFKNRLACQNVAVEVESYCAEKSEQGINYSCVDQKIILSEKGGRSVTKDLLEKEKEDNYHIATSLRCVSTAAKSYLLVSLDNGGNCDDCDVAALMDLSGKWIYYGDRWFVSSAEKTEITNSRDKWLRAKPLRLENQGRNK